MTDEQRADSVGCYGSPVPAPVRIPAHGCSNRIVPADDQCVVNAPQIPHLGYLTESFAALGYQTASIGLHTTERATPHFNLEHDLVLSERVGYFAHPEAFSTNDAEIVHLSHG